MQLYRLFVALDAAGVTDVAPYADAVGVVAVGDVALGCGCIMCCCSDCYCFV